MKKTFKTIHLLAFALILTTFSCSNDSDDSNNVTAQNLIVAIDENPINSQSVGMIQVNGSATLTFSIVSQSPAGALSIDAITGELTVANTTLFNFETNPTITANINVDGASNSATATINLNNVNEIGDYNYGGVVFWIDPSDETKGLVCAVEDQSSGIIWVNPSGMTSPVSGTSTDFGTGSINTDLIIANEGTVETSYAAGLARAYNGGGFNDWFLPSSGECMEMYNNKVTINTTAVANGGSDFSSIGYWSSTRQPSTTNSVYLFYFTTGSANGVLPINARNVRAVRSF